MKWATRYLTHLGLAKPDAALNNILYVNPRKERQQPQTRDCNLPPPAVVLITVQLLQQKNSYKAVTREE